MTSTVVTVLDISPKYRRSPLRIRGELEIHIKVCVTMANSDERHRHRGFFPGETGDYGNSGEIRNHKGSVIKWMFVPQTSRFYNN